MVSKTARGRRHKSNATYERKLKRFSAVLCLPSLCLLGVVLHIEHASTLAMAGSLAIATLVLLLVVFALVEQMVRPLQTLANVVAALREGDYSFRARGARRGDSLGELALEINALADTLQSQRLNALEATALLRRVIAEMDAPVLAFDQEAKLRLLNPAAERVFLLDRTRDLGRPAAEINLEQLLCQPDEGLMTLEARGQQRQLPARYMIRRSSFRQRGVPHTLLLLSDVSSALREEERTAWQRLIRVLGHEISNSLAPIKSIAGSLRSRLPADSADFERGLTIIESRAESLNRFVQAYRQLAQLPAPVLRRVPLRPLLERVIGLETRLDVELDAPSGVDLFADSDQLEQLLINIVRNAVEAALAECDEARLEGRESAAPSAVVLGTRVDGGIMISVEDNGPGITNYANLFVPFYTTKAGGTGVGLALARQIAEAHGGTLELKNRTDAHGCRAALQLPLAAPAVSID